MSAKHKWRKGPKGEGLYLEEMLRYVARRLPNDREFQSAVKVLAGSRRNEHAPDVDETGQLVDWLEQASGLHNIFAEARAGRWKAVWALMLLSERFTTAFHEMSYYQPAHYKDVLERSANVPIVISTHTSSNTPLPRELKRLRACLGKRAVDYHGNINDPVGRIAVELCDEIRKELRLGLNAPKLGKRPGPDNWNDWYLVARALFHVKHGMNSAACRRIMEQCVTAPSKRGRGLQSHFFTMLREKIKSFAGANKI